MVVDEVAEDLADTMGLPHTQGVFCIDGEGHPCVEGCGGQEGWEELKVSAAIASMQRGKSRVTGLIFVRRSSSPIQRWRTLTRDDNGTNASAPVGSKVGLFLSRGICGESMRPWERFEVRTGSNPVIKDPDLCKLVTQIPWMRFQTTRLSLLRKVGGGSRRSRSVLLG